MSSEDDVAGAVGSEFTPEQLAQMYPSMHGAPQKPGRSQQPAPAAEVEPGDELHPSEARDLVKQYPSMIKEIDESVVLDDDEERDLGDDDDGQEPELTADGIPKALSEVRVPDGWNLDPEAVAPFHEKAVELGVSAEHQQELLQWYLQQQAADHKAVLDGWRGDVADADVEMARTVVSKYGSEELLQAVDDGNTSPGLIELLANVGEDIRRLTRKR